MNKLNENALSTFSNSILINTNKYIYPNNTLPPVWVQEKLNKFTDSVNEISRSDKEDKSKYNIEIIMDTLFDNKNYKIPKVVYPFSKKNIKYIIKELANKYNDRTFMWYYYILYYIGFYFSTIKPSAFTPESLELPKEFETRKKQLINDLKTKVINEIKFQSEITKLSKDVVKYLQDKKVPLMDFITSGAKGEIGNIQDILVGVGLSINSKGEIIDVIENSLSEGLTQTQFFNNSSQAIQTLYAKSSETAKPGYLGRKLETLTEGVKLSQSKDCNSREYLEIEVKSQEMLDALENRNYLTSNNTLNSNSLKKVDSSDKSLIGKKIKLRSPLFCKATDGICNTCYDEVFIKDMELHAGSNIGLIASTGLIGDLVNLTLKGSHIGISLNQEEINFMNDLEEYM